MILRDDSDQITQSYRNQTKGRLHLKIKLSTYPEGTRFSRVKQNTFDKMLIHIKFSENSKQ